MNKLIFSLLLIPMLLAGICAVSASEDSGAEIPVVEHPDDNYSINFIDIPRLPPIIPKPPLIDPTPIPPLIEIPEINNEALQSQ